ncbi:hypothetical protein PN36_32880 [Candidatus Thiomargarita nelsonii]|uniref:Uncharacterized protein n=1 Tax=Candidatus Thiomargarita nelsonii TaxID=1003181 RepID=A0A0A6RVC9_9GAMM|nr:hypothetical protein PN36_32880 [Candidatus Thiomargarita nelsonii]
MMSESTLVIHMPEQLYQRLQRFTVLTRRSLESAVLQLLNANVPSLPEDLPESMREIWLALEKLDDDALWNIARSTISQQHQEQYSRLLEKNSQASLTATEQTLLEKRYLDAHKLANLLLKWRGFPNARYLPKP